MRAYLFIETNTSMSLEIVAETYKEAEKELKAMNEPGDWRYDSSRKA